MKLEAFPASARQRSEPHGRPAPADARRAEGAASTGQGERVRVARGETGFAEMLKALASGTAPESDPGAGPPARTAARARPSEPAPALLSTGGTEAGSGAPVAVQPATGLAAPGAAGSGEARLVPRAPAPRALPALSEETASRHPEDAGASGSAGTARGAPAASLPAGAAPAAPSERRDSAVAPAPGVARLAPTRETRRASPTVPASPSPAPAVASPAAPSAHAAPALASAPVALPPPAPAPVARVPRTADASPGDHPARGEPPASGARAIRSAAVRAEASEASPSTAPAAHAAVAVANATAPGIAVTAVPTGPQSPSTLSGERARPTEPVPEAADRVAASAVAGSRRGAATASRRASDATARASSKGPGPESLTDEGAPAAKTSAAPAVPRRASADPQAEPAARSRRRSAAAGTESRADAPARAEPPGTATPLPATLDVQTQRPASVPAVTAARTPQAGSSEGAAPGQVDGAVLRSAAHLRISAGQGGAGDIELHLRIRGGVAHLRVEGDGGHLVGSRAPELASALAGAGLTLGKLEAPAAPSAAPSSHLSFGDGRGQGGGQPGTFESPGDGQPQPGARGDAHPPAPTPSRSPPGRSPSARGGIHVEA